MTTEVLDGVFIGQEVFDGLDVGHTILKPRAMICGQRPRAIVIEGVELVDVTNDIAGAASYYVKARLSLGSTT